MIPKTLHFIWVGDESKMPNECIDTWRVKNPEYGVRVWGNYELHNMLWHNIDKVRDMLAKKDYAGVSDIMRYEILHSEGGVYIDADSYCVKPLEDWLLDCEAFAAWEQEFIRNNLISNGFIGGVKGARIWQRCIEKVSETDCAKNELAWLITGPVLLTELFFKEQLNLTVYPSHYFMPSHHTGYKSPVTGNNFACHLWGSEIGYDNMDNLMEEKNGN